MSIIIFILVLSFLVIIHELGHFFAARWAGVTAEEFGVGYPPRALKLFRWRGTDFTLNWVPFGGFVRMAGEELKDGKKAEAGQFVAAPLWKRQVIILAGATVNFLFGVLAFTLVFSLMGIPTPIEQPRIGSVAPNTPAAEAGIPTEVQILSLSSGEEQVAVQSSEDVIAFVAAHQGETVTIQTTGTCSGLSCQEVSKTFEAYLRTPEETPANEGSLGISFQQVAFVHHPWWQMPFRSVGYGLEQALFLGEQILIALRQLVTDVLTKGSVPAELAGPVGIVHQAEQQNIFDQGWLMVVSFAGMLSINLAIMNVLPIPPLDGGRAVFSFLELVLSRKHLVKLEHYLNYGGYVILLALIILVTIRDVVRVFVG